MATLFNKNDEMQLEFISAYASRADSDFLGPKRISEEVVQEINKLNTTKKRLLTIFSAEDEATVILTNKLYCTKLHMTEYLGMPAAVIGRISDTKVQMALLQEVSKFKQDKLTVKVYGVVSGVFEVCCDSRGYYYE